MAQLLLSWQVYIKKTINIIKSLWSWHFKHYHLHQSTSLGWNEESILTLNYYFIVLTFYLTWEKKLDNHTKTGSQVICLGRHKTWQELNKLFNCLVATHCPSCILALWIQSYYKHKITYTVHMYMSLHCAQAPTTQIVFQMTRPWCVILINYRHN